MVLLFLSCILFLRIHGNDATVHFEEMVELEIQIGTDHTSIRY